MMENDEIIERINDISLEHKDLSDALHLLQEKPFVDEIQLRRLKKRKLKIKDELELLESKLIPDIEA